MSRHRNVRNYAYEEDMYDDVYGHSVEEHDLCVSPTTAQQFLYRRGEHPNLSSFMEEPPGYEEEEYEDGIDGFGAQKEYKTPKLDKESQAKLLSCMDQFRSILGDNCDEEEATAAILKHDFDLERAIDDVLNKGGNQDLKSHSSPRREKDVLKIVNNVGVLTQGSCSSKPVQGFQNEVKQFHSLLGGVDKESETQGLSLLLSKKDADISLQRNNEKSVKNKHTKNEPLTFINEKSKGCSPLALLLERPGKTTGQSCSALPKSPLSQLTERQQDNPSKESFFLSPLARISSEKQSLTGVQQNRGSKLILPSNAEPATTNETEELKSSRSLIEQSRVGNDSSLLPLLNTLNIQDTSKSPHSTSLVNIPNAERPGSSPLSQLLKDTKKSLVTKDKISTGESLQKVPPIVHIPRNDAGSSPLSKLLRTRQSPKSVSYDTKDGLDGNSKFSVDKGHSSSKTMGASFKQPSQDHQSSSDVNKGIDLSTLLMRTKSEKKPPANLPRRTDLFPPDENPRVLSKVDDSVLMVQPMEVDQNFGACDPDLELLHPPSSFACTLFVYYKKPGFEWKPTLKESYQNDVGIVPFDFNKPLHDNVTKSKQKKSASLVRSKIAVSK